MGLASEQKHTEFYKGGEWLWRMNKGAENQNGSAASWGQPALRWSSLSCRKRESERSRAPPLHRCRTASALEMEDSYVRGMRMGARMAAALLADKKDLPNLT